MQKDERRAARCGEAGAEPRRVASHTGAVGGGTRMVAPCVTDGPGPRVGAPLRWPAARPSGGAAGRAPVGWDGRSGAIWDRGESIGRRVGGPAVGAGQFHVDAGACLVYRCYGRRRALSEPETDAGRSGRCSHRLGKSTRERRQNFATADRGRPSPDGRRSGATSSGYVNCGTDTPLATSIRSSVDPEQQSDAAACTFKTPARERGDVWRLGPGT